MAPVIFGFADFLSRKPGFAKCSSIAIVRIGLSYREGRSSPGTDCGDTCPGREGTSSCNSVLPPAVVPLPWQTDRPDTAATCRQPLVPDKKEQQLRSPPQVHPSRTRRSDGCRYRRTRRNDGRLLSIVRPNLRSIAERPLKTEYVRASGRIWIPRLATFVVAENPMNQRYLE